MSQALTLEHYLTFLENPNHQSLFITQLNQIICMHGFAKMYHRPKKDIVDALNSMQNLLLPFRSTLKDRVSPKNASLSTHQVAEELQVLGWKECGVQSVEAVNWCEERVDQVKKKKKVLVERLVCWGGKKKRKRKAVKPIRSYY